MRLTTGHSNDLDAREATAQAIQQCRAELGDEQPVAGLIFAGVGYEHAQILAAVQTAWPQLPIVGCSTDGEFSSAGGYHDDSVLLALLSGTGIRAQVGVGTKLSAGVDKAVASALEQAMAGQTEAPAVCITTPESMTANCTDIVDSLRERLKEQRCPIVGGVSGDHREYRVTYQFAGGQVFSDAIPVLLLWGDITVSCGVASGWKAVGPSHTITHAEGNVVYKIDNKTALDLFADYWGDARKFESLGEFPLAVFPDPSRPDDFFLRAVFGLDKEAGSATFAATVPNGAQVRLTQVLREGILKGSALAMAQAEDNLGEAKPFGALVFSCAARKWLLGTQVAEESATLHDARSKGRFPIVGFYAFGEIAPLSSEGVPFFHNETCVAVIFGSRN